MGLNELCVYNLWSGTSVTAAGTTLTSHVIDMGHAMSNIGTTNCAFQYYVQGAGATLQLTYEASLDGINFIKPTDYKISTVGTNRAGVTIAHNTGVASNGRDILQFRLGVPVPLIRFNVWEINTVGASLDMFFVVK